MKEINKKCMKTFEENFKCDQRKLVSNEFGI